MLAANIVFACETLLVVAGIIWMLAVVRTRARVAGADRPRLGLIQPTGELITAAALSLGAGWAVTAVGAARAAGASVNAARKTAARRTR